MKSFCLYKGKFIAYIFLGFPISIHYFQLSFKSSTNNRSYWWYVDTLHQHRVTIPQGFPQGSVLGPLLLLIYIIDHHKAILPSETFHFVDDTHFYTLILTWDRSKPGFWAKANKISLNASKTKSSSIIGNFLTFVLFLKINGKKIFQSSCLKYLGVLIDSHLNWKARVSFLSAKLSSVNGIISKLMALCFYQNSHQCLPCSFQFSSTICLSTLRINQK